MEVPIIKEIVVIFALSIAVLLICHRLGLPAVVGFLLTGVLCGPHGLGFVKAVHDVENLATIGVVLLLFTVGMEFSIKNIIKYKYYFFCGGALQVFGTLFACVAISHYGFGTSWAVAWFAGFLITLSSTAIVLRALDEKGDNESPHGRLIIGVLVFQDIVAVPMMLLIPMLSGTGEEFELAHLYNFLKGIAFLVIISIVAFRGVPKLLYYVTRTRSRELFLLSVLTICFAVAWLTSSIGLSLSLGAFLAGLVVSESEYSDEAVGNVLPFQAIFTSFFFVSMGMLLDVGFVFQQPFLIVGVALAILLIKTLVAGGGAMILGMPLRAAVLAGIALSQVGEFSFVLAHTGMSFGLATDYQYQLFLAVSLLTMAVTPTLMALSHPLSHWVNKLPFPARIKTGFQTSSDLSDSHHLDGHMIIVGFGVRGRHLARAAKEANIPYLILEMNSETVKIEKKKGEPIHYGDPTHLSVLLHAGIRSANTIAVVINDPVASLRIVKAARSVNPNVYIISRTRYFNEATRMFQAGANDVLPDEFGSSIEISSRVLNHWEMPQEFIATCLNNLRIEGLETLNWHSSEAVSAYPIALDSGGTRIETMQVSKGSPLVGKTLADSDLKKLHGLTVILIKRKNEAITSLQGNTLLQEADSLIVVGTPKDLKKVKQVFQPT